MICNVGESIYLFDWNMSKDWVLRFATPFNFIVDALVCSKYQKWPANFKVPIFDDDCPIFSTDNWITVQSLHIPQLSVVSASDF